MLLNDTLCRTLKPKEKAYKKSDGQGLHLLIKPNGKKYWRMNYRFGGKSKTLAFGVYPDVPLKQARQKREDARALLSMGKDPSVEKQKAKIQALQSNENTFQAIANEWLTSRKENLSENYYKQLHKTLLQDICPIIGLMSIHEIKSSDLLVALRQIEQRGALDMARKARQCCGQIFRYAIATGRAEHDVAHNLKGALKTRKSEHNKYLLADQLPEFYQRLNQYDGEPLTRLGLELKILTMVRTKELRGAQWVEFDFNKALWRIPAERMKMGRPHIVPISKQSLHILEQLKVISGQREYVFPNSVTPQKPMSENTLLYCLYRLGYHSRATVHGFRATASTILHEHGFNSDVIERQLAHVEGNQVKAAYNHAEYLNERTAMLQWWADFIDEQKLTPT